MGRRCQQVFQLVYRNTKKQRRMKVQLQATLRNGENRLRKEIKNMESCLKLDREERNLVRKLKLMKVASKDAGKVRGDQRTKCRHFCHVKKQLN